MQTLYSCVHWIFAHIFGDYSDLVVQLLYIPAFSWNYVPQVRGSHKVLMQFPKPRLYSWHEVPPTSYATSM